jgi:hypothetical protein
MPETRWFNGIKQSLRYARSVPRPGSLARSKHDPANIAKVKRNRTGPSATKSSAQPTKSRILRFELPQ